MKRFNGFLALILGTVLVACGSGQAAALTTPPISAAQPNQAETQPAQAVPGTTQAKPMQYASSPDLTRFDNQGMVTVEIKPLNLDNPGDTLKFEVSLNTHSVDLNKDLAKLAFLTTDTGFRVPSTLWDAPHSGHHISGTLSFPARINGSLPLHNARMLTLTILNLDGTGNKLFFVWDLQQ